MLWSAAGRRGAHFDFSFPKRSDIFHYKYYFTKPNQSLVANSNNNNQRTNFGNKEEQVTKMQKDVNTVLKVHS
jgi:hypothetical protein